LVFHCCSEKTFGNTLLRTTASEAHLARLVEGFGWKESLEGSETEIYAQIGYAFPEPELREEDWETRPRPETSKLITEADLRGILHNHSTWSDGTHSLEEMARYCKELGYEYLGICDHSRSAFYANGLSIERVAEQHREIDQLNEKLAPFRILKGIESDILTDGSLDYPDDILDTFDLVVASVHSVFKMDEAKATTRLIRAIEHPATTILGHPTGRLLLSRPGYPIDHRKVIDACAANDVILELNANPYRLDLDWRWIPYALDKGVMISINPDAHRKEGYHDLHFGVRVARKGGLTKEMTYNALSLAEMEKRL
jgi:DNA polymerase (family 10)